MKYFVDSGLTSDQLLRLAEETHESVRAMAFFQGARPVRQIVDDLDEMLSAIIDHCTQLETAARTMRSSLGRAE